MRNRKSLKRASSFRNFINPSNLVNVSAGPGPEMASNEKAVVVDEGNAGESIDDRDGTE